MQFSQRQLAPRQGVLAFVYVCVRQLLAVLRLEVLPITPEIALLSCSDQFEHGDPAACLIGATALPLGSRLINFR